jgi:hypothetical protein
MAALGSPLSFPMLIAELRRPSEGRNDARTVETGSAAVLIAVVAAVVTGLAVPAVSAGVRVTNADKVDGRHAVGSGATQTERARKLVATGKNGKLPNGIIARAPRASRSTRGPTTSSASTRSPSASMAEPARSDWSAASSPATRSRSRRSCCRSTWADARSSMSDSGIPRDTVSKPTVDRSSTPLHRAAAPTRSPRRRSRGS